MKLIILPSLLLIALANAGSNAPQISVSDDHATKIDENA